MIGAEKKGSISEEDTSLLLQRYTATTILALLQEVYQFAGSKIDWNALVKKSSTGISNAREYQMLWRHLAYCDTLLEKVEEGAEPLDDDSDIEFESEAVPSVSAEALSEAAACVKVLISSGLSNDCGPTNRSTVEAPLTINIPNGQTSHAPSDEQQITRANRGMNITVPVSVQKQSLPTAMLNDGFDGNASASLVMRAKKKRKLWTKEEDEELIAAVQKYGEGNWANILKGDFKHDRTASQLSQRWSTIRKRQGNLNPGGGNVTSSSTQSEQVLATRKAVSMALNMPTLGSLSSTSSGLTQSNIPSSFSTPATVSSETPPVSSPQVLQQAPIQATSQKEVSIPSNKSHITLKRIVNSSKPLVASNSRIQAAAVAAGGRLANPSITASFLRVAQSKTAVHIKPGGSALPKPSVTPTKFLPTARTSGLQPSCNRPTVMPPPPVHSGTTPSTSKVGGQQVQESSGRPPATCAAAPISSDQQTTIGSKSGPSTRTALQENADKVGDDISAVDLYEIDLDNMVAHDKRNLDVSETVYMSGNAGESQSGIGLEKDLSNSEAAEGQSVGNDAGGAQVQVGKGTELPNGESGVFRSTETASGTSHNVAEKQSDCLEASADAVEEHQ